MEELDEKLQCAECDRTLTPEELRNHDGLDICANCWPDYADENGLCLKCGNSLEGIYENNGYTEPDPTHFEITGYKPCDQCYSFEN